MPHSPQSARAIAERLLHVTGEALMAQDFDAFRTCFALPYVVETFEGQQRITTDEEFLAVFQAVSEHLRHIGVTDMVRHCVEARFQTDTRLVSTHESRLLNGRVLLQTPYPTYSVIELHAGAWRIVSSAYAIADAPRHNAALLGTSAQSQHENGQNL